MKTTILNKILVVFLLTLSIWGCRYDHVVPEPESVYNPVVEANAYALPESIPYAGTTTIYWKSENVTLVTINDVPVSSLSGSKTLDSVVKDTTLNFKFTTYNRQVITKSVSIEVAEPVIVVPTRTDTLCERYWMMVSSKIFSQGNWYTVNLDEDRLTRKLYFYKNGFYEVFKKDGSTVGNGYWNFVGQDSIKIGGPTYGYQLTDTTFVCYHGNETEKSIIVDKGYKITQSTPH
jgi:hypothetical protein